MRTITLVAYNRPTYTSQVIVALAEALIKPDQQAFDKLIFSIDPGNPNVWSVCESAAEVLSKNGIVDCEMYENTQVFGVAGNQFMALQRAFEEQGSDFNLSIEDDACLAPDAVLLATWFYKNHGGPLSDYTLMSMCNHRDFGRGMTGNIQRDSDLIAESPYITSPFAWCLSKWQWPFVKSSWNFKESPPNGWDFSLSMAMRLQRRKALHPVISRCKNIGREGGANGTPEDFDATQTNISYSDGEYPGPYRIAAKLPYEEIMKLDSWMLTEKGKVPFVE